MYRRSLEYNEDVKTLVKEKDFQHENLVGFESQKAKFIKALKRQLDPYVKTLIHEIIR